MSKVTSAFVIVACSVVIGWGGITLHNHLQKQYRENALEQCTKSEKYSYYADAIRRMEEASYTDSGLYDSMKLTAREMLDACLGKYGLKVKH